MLQDTTGWIVNSYRMENGKVCLFCRFFQKAPHDSFYSLCFHTITLLSYPCCSTDPAVLQEFPTSAQFKASGSS